MGFRLIGITAAVLGSGLLAGSVPMLAPKAALAQDAPVPFSAVRALNLARNTARNTARKTAIIPGQATSA